MDKNTVTGLLLIFAIIMGYMYFTKPSQEEIEAQKREQDSLRLIELQQQQAEQQPLTVDTVVNKQSQPLLSNTTPPLQKAKTQNVVALQNQYGVFANAAEGQEEFHTIENELIKVRISTQGGRIYSVELKDFKRYDGSPLILFDGEGSKFQLNFFSSDNRSVNTQNLFFQAIENNSADAMSLTMRLRIDSIRYIDYTYTLQSDSYMLGFDIIANNMNDVISHNSQYVDFVWAIKSPSQEKGTDFEDTYTSIFYKYKDDEVDELSPSKDFDEKTLSTPLKWVAFKQHFFSMILVADKSFANVNIKSEKIKDDTKLLKSFDATMSLPYNGNSKEINNLKFYFGPNKYKVLKAQDKLGLEKLIPLGWGIFGWINRYLVIPVFNFLEGFIVSYGLIILILTIIIKVVLFPLTYKSYLSTAKMKVLKPEVDELTKKYPKEKAMEKQQATMKLYKKAGVNPMGGCLPMLLQMPILFAMFRFFPASIELRQKGFLWADDLSSYDSILDLPFSIPFYGDHVSLFCLLMAITNIVYTKMNQSMASSTQTMPGMNTMMYMMPVMFLFFFNNYASGLSYYYFVSTLITIAQTLVIRRMVDEKKILAKLQANKKKPAKKSKFQERLEKMAKQKGYRK